MYENNDKDAGITNGWDIKVRLFSSSEFWKSIGFILLDPTFSLWVSMLWKKEEEQNISGNNRNISSIRMKVYFYEVCLSYIIYCIIYFIL